MSTHNHTTGYWAKALLDIVEVLEPALSNIDLLTINKLNTQLEEYNTQLFCDHDAENEAILRSIANNLALILYEYENPIAQKKLIRYKNIILRSLRNMLIKPEIVQVKRVEKIAFPISKKNLSKAIHLDTQRPQKEYQAVRYSEVVAFFATNRAFNTIKSYGSNYGSERGPMRYGECAVSIPKKHHIGEVETPWIIRLQILKNPDKHVTLLRLKDYTLSDLKSRIDSFYSEQYVNNALVFIHGFNVSFEDAALRTAQIAYDLEFKGLPFFFSWPSKNRIDLYSHDQSNSNFSVNDIAKFLTDIADHSCLNKIFLIAHSMGGECAINAIKTLHENEYENIYKFQEIILAAPDIDADMFMTSIAPKILDTDHPLTLYMSSKDKALKASKIFHGSERLGSSKNKITILSGMETIDAGATDLSFLGHSYFGNNRPVLSDINSLINHNQRPDNRFGLREAFHCNDKYWVFKK